jgi:D-alanyl-D-alanine carboxypeptidase (penicillin-binding protein 5/6)
MKKLCVALCALLMLLGLCPVVRAVELPLASQSAVLMEKETGWVLYEKNAHDRLAPASVTKVMTLLLVMEAIDNGVIGYDDMVTASAYAVSMGGSQVYLKEGEQMSVEDLLKAVCVASGNDAAVALAEYVAGSNDGFVEKMNARAAELGMNDTYFVNCTGLPAPDHVTSAYDIAVMSRELILHHPDIRRFTTIWMDSLRGGAFGLSNTNKLIRFYDGATGLKTGSTDDALYCLSATAERNGMELIAATLKADTSDHRFEDAKALLNYGFSSYVLYNAAPETVLPPLSVTLGVKASVQPVLTGSGKLLVEKAQAPNLRKEVSLPQTVEAPVDSGTQLGTLDVYDGDTLLTQIPLTAGEGVARMNWGQMMLFFLRRAVLAQ